jgi:hypothetical protein
MKVNKEEVLGMMVAGTLSGRDHKKEWNSGRNKLNLSDIFGQRG